MRTLNVSIEREGKLVPAGMICGEGSSDARFQYSDSYLSDPKAAALSVSLPLTEKPYSARQTRTFFEGLLPEGFTRLSVAQWMHFDERDYLSILHALGRECIGAISVTEEDEKVEESYTKLTKEQVRELAAEGAEKSAELVTKAHLSLTGASGKVGLYHSGNSNSWYLPGGTAPSTHIVKQSHVRLDAIVTNEQLSLITARRCGIEVPHSFIINTGKGTEREVLFATERYDRFFPKEQRLVNGLPCPMRLHQEDFAQAMGIPSSEKYGHGSDSYLKEMFDILRRYSSNPIADQLRLWDTIVFDFLIGNTDAHIKNFSLLYGTDLKEIRLTPVYDLVSTTVYEQSTRDMAFCIGGAYSVDELTEEHFRRAAGEAGIGERIAMLRFFRMRDQFRAALHQSAEELSAQGYQKAAWLEDKILSGGGIRNV